MAANLVRAGFHLRVWNRTLSRTAELAELGAVPAATPADATRGADIVVTMLADGPAVGVQWTRQLAKDAAAFNVTYVDAPVSGSEGPAKSGDLVILASGPADVRDTLAPVFAALGKLTSWLGEAGAGTRAKLVLNNLLVDLVEATAESLRFAASLDLDLNDMVELLQVTPLGAPYTVQKARTMLAGDFRPVFALKHAVKDAGLRPVRDLRGEPGGRRTGDRGRVAVDRRLLRLHSVEIETSAGPAHVDLTVPDGHAPSFLAVLTHGAGGTPDTADVLAVRDAARALGAATALVTQPYRVKGARAPGSAARQDQAWTEIVEALTERTGGIPLIQCGRSNGARVACRTAQAVRARGVIALAFPLHPPGHPEKSRAGELAAAGTPVLVINGDRDPFGIPDGGDATSVVVLSGETHALSKNVTAIGETVAAWLGALPGIGRL